MDNENQQGPNNQESNSGGTMIPGQFHHRVPTSSPVFRGRGRRASGERVGGAIKGGAKSLGKTAAKQGAKKAATWLMSNPYVLAGILIAIIFVIFIVIIISAIITSCENYWDDPIGNAPLAFIGNTTGLCSIPKLADIQTPAPPTGVTVNKTGPERIENGTPIVYTITVSYDNSIPNAITPDQFGELNLYDVPVFDHELSSATGNPQTITSDPSGEIYYIWDLPIPSGPTIFTYTITLIPQVENFVIRNAAYTNTSFQPVVEP